MVKVNFYISVFVVVHNTFLISFQYFFVIFQFVFLFKFCFLQITNTEKIVFHKKFLVFLFSKLLFTFVFLLSLFKFTRFRLFSIVRVNVV